MAKMLLINPRKRRTARKTRKAPTAKQRANWARFAAAARKRSAGYAANPAKRRARRKNPAGRSITRAYRRVTRRRRNPISLGGAAFNFASYLTPIKDAAIMGAGGVAMDVGYSYVNRMLPASMQRTPGVLGVGDAIKAFATVLIGRLLSKPTRGLSNKAAMGALTVQAYNAAASFLPATMPVNGMGYVTAGRVVPGSGRTNTNQRAAQMGRVGQYVGGGTPLLSGGVSQYVGGGSPLLSRSPVRR
jgi:hypothetical protein